MLGSLLLSAVGNISRQATTGGVAGLFLGAIIGLGAVSGWIHRITAGAISVALLFCAIGPGFDDYSGISAIPGALLGAFLGWLGWKSLLAFFSAILVWIVSVAGVSWIGVWMGLSTG